MARSILAVVVLMTQLTGTDAFPAEPPRSESSATSQVPYLADVSTRILTSAHSKRRY
jgi:hypothetical protein